MTAFLILLIAASSVTSCARRTKFNPFVVPYTPPGRMMQQGHIHSQVNPLHIQMQDFPSRPPGAGARAALRAAQEMDFASPFARHMREFQQLREHASNSPQLVLEERDMTMARSRSSISMTMARSRRSISLPFVDAPGYLDGVLPGDVGFDPLGFADETNLARMREAEIRHGRLAMVATWGWPTAEIGLRIAQALVPPASVCTGNGCAIDATTTGLKLETIALIGETYWTTLLLAAIVGELRARRLPVGVPAFDPLNLASRLSDNDDEAARLALAELKHGRLAMAAFAAYGIQNLSSGQLTFAHQLWGETCVNSLRVGGKAAGISTACFPQDLQKFDFVLSWEILYRVLTGYFSEPYF